MTTTTLRWRRARRPVALRQVTAAMVAPIQQAADASMLPQTVWPSIYYGPDFVGEDCLLISACAILDTVPSQAAAGSSPLFTVLARSYFRGACDDRRPA